MDGALTTGMYAWYTPIRSGGRSMHPSQRRRAVDGAVARSKGIGAMQAPMTHACDVWRTRYPRRRRQVWAAALILC
ncbi:hypothetical protein EYR27_00655 [Xanthomonas oryzae]|nr:hypothetical protein EYR27_00655 [Xanthomonas oryzae]